MLEDCTLDALPKRKNRDIRLIATSARRVAVIQFSGFNTDNTIDAHREHLLKYVADHRLSVAGKPTTAFYNPPWTLPCLRRNEIMVDVR
jgi:hypothetical protein